MSRALRQELRLRGSVTQSTQPKTKPAKTGRTVTTSRGREMKTKCRYTVLQLLAIIESRVGRYTKMAKENASDMSRTEFSIMQGKVLALAELRDTIHCEKPILDYEVGDA